VTIKTRRNRISKKSKLVEVHLEAG